MTRHLIMLLLTIGSSTSYADIYKCIDQKGQIFFSDTQPQEDMCKRIQVCVPDKNKWSRSSVAGVFYLNEATRLTVGRNQFVQIWISRLEDTEQCTFNKEYLTVDCISKAVGRDWFSVSPIDPDTDMYAVIHDICKNYPARKK